MIKVTILTIDPQPTFEVKWGTTPMMIADRIFQEYGLQTNGEIHQWMRDAESEERIANPFIGSTLDEFLKAEGLADLL